MEENIIFSVRMPDHCTVESVYYGSGTLCISSQVGCNVRCPFCLSGTKGLFRDLTCDELKLQLFNARDKGLAIKRVTLSGIGEPLHNWKNVLAFMEFCDHEKTPLSLTTIGAPLKNLDQLFQLPHNGLMLSLHAGTVGTHRKMVPGGPPFEGLWDVLRYHYNNMSRRKRKKIGINYLLIQRVNDSIDELERLLMLLKPFPELTLHLLGCNSNSGSSLVSPGTSGFDAAYTFLRSGFSNVRRNNRWRRQKNGGCGTLLACTESFPR